MEDIQSDSHVEALTMKLYKMIFEELQLPENQSQQDEHQPTLNKQFRSYHQPEKHDPLTWALYDKIFGHHQNQEKGVGETNIQQNNDERQATE